MFIRTQYTQCGNADYHNVKLHALEHTVFDDLMHACRYTVEHIEVADTISEEEMATLIMRELKWQVRNGVDISDLCRIIKEYFGVALPIVATSSRGSSWKQGCIARIRCICIMLSKIIFQKIYVEGKEDARLRSIV